MSYEEFLKELYSLQDLKYKEFNSKIVVADNLIGVRTPELKRLAKIIARSDYDKFINENKHEYYEDSFVHGLVLGYLKLDYDELIKYIDDFLPHIDSWAICDSTVANLKTLKKNITKDKCFNKMKEYIKSPEPFTSRFGYMVLLDYFIEEKYMDDIFDLCKDYQDHYYVKMAIAFLISVCYVKQKGRTLTFLKNNKLDDWTYNKSIQKILESSRVSNEDKKMLRSMKRK